MVKHERTHLRNLLLTNARQEHLPRELGPIPRLMDLLVLINRAFKPRSALRTMAEIRANMTAGVQDLIDDHLEALRVKSPLELQVHAILVIRRDQELFTGNVMFADIPDESIQMPGPIELDVEIRDVQARFGLNPSPEVMLQLLESKIAPPQ
ncbi:hypothetical protein PCANC_04061 [Puccinia coronata f. sp. avenae]|uniref:Uncharacterized protein n=1 Tax=Puccinia coronata f. sp. avenae TaxID=200324 RepID=A0A2N5W2A9_9BASI|nr:hypothetical protein PCANC_04061 [Puccinia coronata f. sp. avenae]